MKRVVLVSDEAVQAQLVTYAEALRFGKEHCVVSWLPLYHDMVAARPSFASQAQVGDDTSQDGSGRSLSVVGAGAGRVHTP